MKLLFCVDSMNKGGAERVVANLCNILINKYDITIVATQCDKPMYELDSRIKYFMLDKNLNTQNIIFKNIQRIKKLRTILKNQNVAISISFLPTPSYRMMLASVFLKNKTIISVRNDPNVEYNNLFKKILVKILYTKADGFVFQTESAKKWFSKKIRNKSIIIPNPINEEFLCKPYDGIREKTIVNVGRLFEQKNQELLIKAFCDVLEKHGDYKLKIYGEGYLRNKLEKLIDDLKLKDKVILMGLTNNVKDNIYKCSMFVLSSNYEGMPNALMEAMALGLPCISTDCPIGGPKYLIGDNRNGLLVNVNDREDLADAINYLIENQNIAKQFGTSANKFSKTLNPTNIAKCWEDYILNIINY